MGVRRSVISRSLVLVAMLLALSVAGGRAQTPTSNTYVSQQFGYQVAWPSDWTVVATQSAPGGFDMVTLMQRNTVATIIFSRPGDTPLSEIAEFMILGPPEVETFVPGMIETDTAGNEIQGETADRAWIAYAGNLSDEVVDGFTQFRYGEVRRLDGDLGVALSLAMPTGDFDGDIAPYSALLDGVTRVGGTPIAG